MSATRTGHGLLHWLHIRRKETTPMTTIPARLIVDATGRVRDPSGKLNITYNDPWPLKFAKGGVTGKISGNVLHTMVGYLDATITYFNSPQARGSAHFGIGTIGKNDGRLHQFVPLGKGYETYHAYAANLEFYGTETEDGGHPHTPISDAGLWTWAQLEECLSSFAGYRLEELERETGEGLGYHRQFADWNLSHHTCPGESMTDMVRVNQRAVIISRAKQIRAAAQPPPEFHASAGEWTTVPGHGVQVQPESHDVVLRYRDKS